MTINYDFGEREAEETITLNVDVTNSAGNPTDPDAITISVRKPSGDLDPDGIALSRNAEGDYYYYYTISAEIGNYTGRIKAVSGDGKVTMRTFELKAVRSV